MVKFYPVFIKKNDFYVVYIPDFDIYTKERVWKMQFTWLKML